MDFSCAWHGTRIHPLTAMCATSRVERSKTVFLACGNGADERVSGMPWGVRYRISNSEACPLP
jgi:hypothetical protein